KEWVDQRYTPVDTELHVIQEGDEEADSDHVVTPKLAPLSEAYRAKLYHIFDTLDDKNLDTGRPESTLQWHKHRLLSRFKTHVKPLLLPLFSKHLKIQTRDTKKSTLQALSTLIKQQSADLEAIPMRLDRSQHFKGLRNRASY
ncbi:hypothetical protein PTTG_26951, partial [Puccinia triticina 1-1 BBBD Race 1]